MNYNRLLGNSCTSLKWSGEPVAGRKRGSGGGRRGCGGVLLQGGGGAGLVIVVVTSGVASWPVCGPLSAQHLFTCDSVTYLCLPVRTSPIYVAHLGFILTH